MLGNVPQRFAKYHGVLFALFLQISCSRIITFPNHSNLI